jgi:hypothetical protein
MNLGIMLSIYVQSTKETGSLFFHQGGSLSKTVLEAAILVTSGWPQQSPFLEILRLAEKNACEKD